MLERTLSWSSGVIDSRLRRSLWLGKGVAPEADAPRMDVAIIVGSGLANVATSLEEYVRIPYADLPGFPLSGVAGHAGELRLGRLGGCNVALFAGRVHMYEGYSAYDVTYPVRVAAELGARTLIVTNAAGALAPELEPGDLMLISDHINMTGASPIDFELSAEAGVSPFVDLSEAYDPGLLASAASIMGSITGAPASQGVYVGVRGPHYETPAEVAMYRSFGGRAIGMSTVIEVIAARQLDMKVLGVSCITNSLSSGAKVTHEGVLSAGEQAASSLAELITTFIAESCKTADVS